MKLTQERLDWFTTENGRKSLGTDSVAQGYFDELIEHAREAMAPPSFEQAEQIVNDRIAEEIAKLKAQGARNPYISFTLIGWIVYPNGIYGTDNIGNGQGATLAEALAAAPKIPSSEEAKAAKIAKLRAELAELEK